MFTIAKCGCQKCNIVKNLEEMFIYDDDFYLCGSCNSFMKDHDRKFREQRRRVDTGGRDVAGRDMLAEVKPKDKKYKEGR